MLLPAATERQGLAAAQSLPGLAATAALPGLLAQAPTLLGLLAAALVPVLLLAAAELVVVPVLLVLQHRVLPLHLSPGLRQLAQLQQARQEQQHAPPTARQVMPRRAGQLEGPVLLAPLDQAGILAQPSRAAMLPGRVVRLCCLAPPPGRELSVEAHC